MKQQAYIGNNILGAWKLVKWVYEDENNNEVRYFGQSPEGLLIYHESGYMSVQIAQEERKHFESDVLNGGSLEEQSAAFTTFLSYYGTFVEEVPGKFVHTVEGTLFPNWLGNKEVRYAEIEGDILILSTPPVKVGEGSITFRISWERVIKEQLYQSNHFITHKV